MLTRGIAQRLSIGVAAALGLSALLHAAPDSSPVADAAMARDTEKVTRLLRDGGDVNAAQGDGMTALHWAAVHGDAELATMLLYAGASTRATTRLGGFAPLHLASQAGHAPVVAALLESGADPAIVTATGATPLMHAAASGSVETVGLLLDHGADPNATESANGQTALMFAAAADRSEVARLLVGRGADAGRTSALVDVTRLEAPEERLQEALRRERQTRPRNEDAPAQGERRAPAPGTRPPEDPEAEDEPASAESEEPSEVPGLTRPYKYNELIGRTGGLTALHFAARQGASQTVRALVEDGADVNQVSPADGTSPLLIATLNGHFDLAAYLLERDADPNLASDAGMTPLYAVLNVEWAPRMFYPQPRAHLQQQTTYLELLRALLEGGADPNARLRRKIWYTQYNFDLLRIDESGATPFWRAAYASDIDAMKLLVAHGADPAIPTTKPASRRNRQGGTRGTDESRDHSGLPPLPVGGPGVPPLLAAAGVGYGEGFAGNAHRFAPTGMLAAVRYLVDELGADLDAVDHDGNTALHHAAARGDNEMILYLVSRGADVTAVNRGGQTTVDMANGPVQRIQPFPTTISLLEKLGAKNNHKCVSC